MRERRQHLFVQHPILLVDEAVRLFADFGKQRAQPGQRHARRRRVREELLLEPRDPDLEELVEVAADDAQEAQPLEHGDDGVLREGEHAPVECELRQLAIDRRRIGWTHRAVGRYGIADGWGSLEKSGAAMLQGSYRARESPFLLGSALPRRSQRWLFVPPTTLAVVDLGSNSFRLQIGRVEGDQIYQLDTWRETLRLGAGLDAKGRLKPRGDADGARMPRALPRAAVRPAPVGGARGRDEHVSRRDATRASSWGAPSARSAFRSTSSAATRRRVSPTSASRTSCRARSSRGSSSTSAGARPSSSSAAASRRSASNR